MRKVQAKKIGKIVALVGAVHKIDETVKALQETYNKYKAYREYVIFIQDNDKMYSTIQSLVVKNAKQKAMKTVQLSYDYGTLKEDYNSTKNVEFLLEEKIFKARFKNTSDLQKEDYMSARPIRGLELVTYSQQDYIFLKEYLKKLSKTINDRTRPAKVQMQKENWWDTGPTIPKRNINSLILKKGQIERIIEDIQKFLISEEIYINKGIPYHRGYLFHGPPGTGKSSIARIIAAKFQKDLYYLNLADIKKDRDLFSFIADIENGILLIEDIDIYQDSVESRKAEKDHVSLAALLNALDGIMTPNGLITIVTTNNKSALDPALIRPGRIDIVEELSYLDEYQIKEICKRFDVDRKKITVSTETAPAELIQKLREITE